MSDMRSGSSFWNYLQLSIQSVILHCFPNCLPMASKVKSTLGLLTSSTLVVSVWFSAESFLLSMSRLECSKAVFYAPILFLTFINDLSDSGKSSISLLMTLLYAMTSLVLTESLFPLFRPWKNHKLVKHLEYVF